jgi:integrase
VGANLDQSNAGAVAENLADLHAQGVLARNVVALVEPLRKPPSEPTMKIDDCLSEAEVETLCSAHADGAGEYSRRREAFVHLALLGLRRGELSGLRWSAVDLDAEEPALSVRATRVNTSAGVCLVPSTSTVGYRRRWSLDAAIAPVNGEVFAFHCRF